MIIVIVLLLLIKCGCFNNMGESVVQQQDGLPFHELCELVSLRTSRESSAIDRVTILNSSIGHVVGAG